MKAEKLFECLGCTEANALRWAEHLTAAMDCYGIDTPQRQAAFLANVGAESGKLTTIEENLRYSANGLLATFPKYFTSPGMAEAYAHKPEQIASRAYANRNGNGDEASGEGWKYRGRGLIQLTGKDAYRACGDALALDLVGQPDLLLQPRPAAMSAGWEWERAKINAFADAGDFDGVCDAINIGHKTAKIGDSNSFAERRELWERAKKALGV